MAKYNGKNSKPKQPYYFKRKKKDLEIIFDEDARREFLTGFRKRKLQRQKKAKQELEDQLKAERKRIKAEAKQAYKKLVVSSRPIPELEKLFSEEINMGTHSVSVTELSTAELAKENNWIGVNQVKYEGEDDGDDDEDVRNSDNKEESLNKIEGMEINSKKANEKEKSKKTNQKLTLPMKTSKDVKKAVKLKANQEIKKSNVFKRKSKLDKMRDIKMKKKEDKKRQKQLRDLQKKGKHKKKK